MLTTPTNLTTTPTALTPTTSNSKKPTRIYLDFQSTTPLDPRVLDAMLPYSISHFGNSSSRTHTFGWTAEQALKKARTQISDVLKCDPAEIIFTSGATESNNLALKGLFEFKKQEMGSVHFITLQTEHKSVLDCLRNLGAEVTYLPVQKSGLLDVNELRKAIKPNTICVSVMGVNNEIGTVQDLNEIGKVCAEHNIVFHCDAAQMFGKLPIDVSKSNIGLLSASGHKICGPKGVGFLYIRKRPRVRLLPLVFGGGQERGLRSGSVPVWLAVGLGKAAEVAKKEMMRDYGRAKELSVRLVEYVKGKMKGVHQNGIENKHEDSKSGDSKDVINAGKGDKQMGTNQENETNKENENKQMNINKEFNDVKNNENNNNKDVSNKDVVNKENNNNKDVSNKDVVNKEIKDDKLNLDSMNLTKHYPGCINLSFDHVEGEGLLMAMKDAALSSGSACTSASLEPSYTLRALGTDDALAHSSIRFGIGRFTTKQDVKKVSKMCVEAVNRLREMSPLAEMASEGIDINSIPWSS